RPARDPRPARRSAHEARRALPPGRLPRPRTRERRGDARGAAPAHRALDRGQRAGGEAVKLALASLAVLACVIVPARAQERGTLAEPGGIVALCASDCMLDANARAQVLGLAPGASESTGTRAIVQLEPGEPADPLAQSTLRAERLVLDATHPFAGETRE